MESRGGVERGWEGRIGELRRDGGGEGKRGRG